MGTINDIIIDSTHLIEYLKYAATRQLFLRRKNKSEDDRLSAVSHAIFIAYDHILKLAPKVVFEKDNDYARSCMSAPGGGLPIPV